MAKLPGIEEFAKAAAKRAIDDYEFNGKTIREWAELLLNGNAVVLPCEVRTQVWLTEWWSDCRLKWEKLRKPLPRNVHHFEIEKDGVFAHFHDGCINSKYFGEIVFLTKEEAQKAIGERREGDG